LKARYTIRVDEALASSIVSALKPDLEALPRECRGSIGLENPSTIILEVACSKSSILKALSNSFISIVLMLLETMEVLKK